MTTRPRIILASASPRRRELLKELVADFEVVPSDIDEDLELDVSPELIAKVLAETKAYAVQMQYPDAIVIGADTVVAVQDLTAKWILLGKPTDAADAARMLRQLSDRKHIVVTGVAVTEMDYARVFSETTTVTFRPISEQEIADYVATGEPMDKAGAYAIQGGAKNFIENTEGSWSNVVGLPLETLRPILEEAIAKVMEKPE